MFYTVIVLLATFLVGWFIYKYSDNKIKQEKIRNIPGPKGYLFVGNALDISTPQKAFTQLLKWKEQYGNLYKVTIGPMLQYVISDVDTLEHITTSNELITKGHYYNYIKRWIGTGLLTATGEKWRSHRKIITPTFHFKILEQFVDIFNKHSDILVKKLENDLGKKSFDLYPYITACTLDVICETAMGVSLNVQANPDTEYEAAVRFLLNNAITRLFSFMKQHNFFYYFTTDYKKEKKHLKIIHDFTYSVIRSRRAELLKSTKSKKEEEDFGTKKRMAFLDMLLHVNINGKPLTDAEIQEEVDTFMFEGHDTTASAITFTIHCLAEHQDVQEKVFEEMEAIYHSDKSRQATYAELQEMKYMEMVIKEVQRIYPTVPFVGRSTTEEFTFRGHTFLEGSTLLLHFHGAHMDPNNFPEPEKFDPERFRGNNTGRSVFSFLPFSAGPRNCIGQKFAMLELKSLLSKILRNYKILPANPRHTIAPGHEGVLKSGNGIMITLEKRSD